MNTDIDFLRSLEADLEDAARRAKVREAEGSQTGPGPSRRSGGSWMSIAAGIVAFLVLAGGIGFLTQSGLNRSKGTASATGPVAEATKAPAQPPGIGLYRPFPVKPAAQENRFKGLPFVSGGATGGTGSNGGNPLSAAAPQAVTGRDLSKIVRDGSISLQIPDKTFSQSESAVAKVARDAGGFVLSSSTQNERSGTFTLRVPARNFDEAMLALRPLGTVEASQQTGKDVTAQFVDLSARLRILIGRRGVILRLMSKAVSIGDTLALQNQFDSVQLQIEQIQGNLNVIRNQVAESTITVDLHEKDSPQPATTAVSTPSLGKSLRLSWQGFLRMIGAVVVGLGYLIPIAVIGLAIWLLMRATRRRRATSTPG
jgi:hypothetical protein